MFHFRPADGNNRLQKQSFLTAKLLRTLIEKDRYEQPVLLIGILLATEDIRHRPVHDVKVQTEAPVLQIPDITTDTALHVF